MARIVARLIPQTQPGYLLTRMTTRIPGQGIGQRRRLPALGIAFLGRITESSYWPRRVAGAFCAVYIFECGCIPPRQAG
jgi:hypothetical protein